MNQIQHSPAQRSKRTAIGVVAAIALVVAGGSWVFGLLQDPAEGAAETAAHPPAIAASAMDPGLARAVDAAKAASAQATADAGKADAVAAMVDEVAAKAATLAAEGAAAAEKARTAAKEACRAPGQTHACATAEDGTHYEGGQACRADGCGPEGFGVFTDANRGWESVGRWENWSLILGCDSMKGITTYCGQQVASAWTGYGISYNANAATISAEWFQGVGKSPLQLDYPTGSHMRGEMTNYELDGLGIYDRNDKRVLRGRWQAGKLVSGVVSYPGSGDRVSGAFVDGNAQSGAINYRDGRVFIGEIDDNPALNQARPLYGALYAPDGSIEKQGAWRDGIPVLAK